MKSFKDNQNRKWEIVLNVAALKRVRDTLQVNLLEIEDGKLIDRLANDPILLVDVLYLVCKDQADKDRVSDEDFGRGMGGAAIDDATTAFLDELVEFFRDPRRRTVLRAVLEKSRQLEARMLEKAEKAVEGMSVDELIRSSSATNSPASSASTPDPSRSESSSG